jgi:Leucine-rich repeat (LRR) protein
MECSNLPELKELVLDGNKITSVRDISGLGIMDLISFARQQLPLECTLVDSKAVDVSGNTIIAWHSQAHELQARFCELKTIPKNILGSFMVNLDLENNQISDITPLAGFQNLKSLNVSCNEITSISLVCHTLSKLQLRQFYIRCKSVT